MTSKDQAIEMDDRMKKTLVCDGLPVQDGGSK
jgi:hypothetical protein